MRVCLPGGRGGGDGASSQGHLVDVVVSRAVQVGQGEVGAGRCSHRGCGMHTHTYYRGDYIRKFTAT